MKKSELIDKSKEFGFDLPEGITNKQMEQLLAIDYYSKHPEVQSWGMTRRIYDFFTPQLCFNYKDLKSTEQENILNSENWLAETKIDGCRMVVTFHPDYGFEFFSRDVSDITMLPNSYTDKILLVMNGLIKTPSSYKGAFKQSFILDGEVIVSDKNLDTTEQGGGFSVTELNATVSILGSSPERAIEIQMNGNTLKFYIFDCLEFDGKNLIELPLRDRRKYLNKLIDGIKYVTPFEIPESTTVNKAEFFDRLVAEGQEGVVLKNLDEKYYVSTSRKRNVQIKMKRSLSDSKNEDIDCFITGFVPPKKGSALDVKNLIGGVKVSLYLTEADGTETEHWIATVSGMTDGLRKKMTILDDEGKPSLNPEYLNKVIAVNGQDISSVSNRMSHARSDFLFRVDKKPTDCLQTREWLLSMVL
jgi:ATP-dependent DNA ligase